MIWNHERFAGCLAGVKAGDTLGKSWESMTHEQIRAITGPEGVTTFWPPQQTGDAPEWAMKMRTLAPEDPTDDWQRTGANTRSILRCGKPVLDDLALENILELRRCRIGWGGTTVYGLMDLAEYFDSKGERGRKPGVFAPRMPEKPEDKGKQGVAAGNGVAMCVAPHALYATQFFTKHGHIPDHLSDFQQIIWDLGGLTHPDPRATVGAFAVASLIARLALRNGDPLERNVLKNLLADVLVEVVTMEHTLVDMIAWARPLSPFSNRLAPIVHMRPEDQPNDLIRDWFGTSSFTLESVPFSIATFLRHPTDFRAAVKEAIEAGGDTDTNAAIVGSLVGANVGVQGIPEDWRRVTRGVGGPEDLGIQMWAMLYEQGHLR